MLVFLYIYRNIENVRFLSLLMVLLFSSIYVNSHLTYDGQGPSLAVARGAKNNISTFFELLAIIEEKTTIPQHYSHYGVIYSIFL